MGSLALQTVSGSLALQSISRTAPLRTVSSTPAPWMARRLFAHDASSMVNSQAFLPSELPAVVDLFSDFANPAGALDEAGLARLLSAVGEPPDATLVRQLFMVADKDKSGKLDLSEFLAAADSILAKNPQVLARCTLVVGGPGSGKGMLSDKLVAECGMGHVSCGDMLRAEVAANTPIGQQAKEIMEKGELLPSSMITTMLRRQLRGAGGRRLLLDGFPRSRQNAIDFEAQCGRPELALNLVCSEEIMLQRIMKRAQSEGRADDTHETALRRIQVFRESGEPTIEWLREAKVPIIELDCSGTPEDVWSQLLVVGRLMRPAVSSANQVLDTAVRKAKERLRATLRRVEAFARLSDDEIATVHDVMTEAKYRRGEWIFRQGDVGEIFHVVVRGAADVVRNDGDGEHVIAHLGPGACFGERALLRDEVRFAGVVAVADEGLQTMCITRNEFETMLGSMPSRMPDPYR